MTVTFAAKKDLYDIARLEDACFSSPWSEDALRETMERGGIFLLCRDGERAIGYIGAYTVLDEGNITDLCTAPDRRREGVGRMLLDAALDALRKKGCRQVFLELRRSNEAAKSLYRSAGFCVTGERKNFYSSPREDALLMEKRL